MMELLNAQVIVRVLIQAAIIPANICRRAAEGAVGMLSPAAAGLAFPPKRRALHWNDFNSFLF